MLCLLIIYSDCLKGIHYLVNLCNDVKELNKDIFNIMSTLPKHKGKKLIKKINSYNEKLEELSLIVRENIVAMQPAISVVLNDGYPKYLDENVIVEDIKKRFNWTDENIEDFNVLKTKTYHAWSELVMLHNEPHTYI